MHFKYLIVATVLFTYAFGANSIEQTDWFSGPGVPGPVTSWEDRFDTSIHIDYSNAGELLLQQTPLEYSEYSPKGYESIGTLISSILEMSTDSRDDSFWGNIFWDAGLPSGTEVTFRVRGSDDPGNMGSWSNPITEWGRNLDDILDEEFAYFQYEATLATSNTSITPELFYVIITSEVDSGGFWVPGTSGTTEFLNDVCFVDSLHGWAVGNNGLILVTYNGGVSWDSQISNTIENLNSVSFVDQLHGWVAGAGGTILYTENGGDVWNLQTSGVTTELNGISFVDLNYGWAVGAGELILATTDGGFSPWTQQHSGSTDLNGVHCADDYMTVTAVGDGGLILGTFDAGGNWNPQTSGVTQNLNDVFMSTPNICHAVGNNGTIINSSNSGQAWAPQVSGTLSDLLSVNFVNVYTGWAVGTLGTILYSERGGEEWLLQPGSRTLETLLGVNGTNRDNAVSTGTNGVIMLYNSTTGIEDNPPERCDDMDIILSPNPFRSLTEISYTLQVSSDIEITVLDISGRIVNRVFSGERESGSHSVEFSGRNQSGDLLPSGVYLCVLRSENRTVSSPMILLR
ncbi:MAG: T9SS type A sorting domain-containing protein [Candidatus Aegiribacteria sp.]|nr:T9SS type A sorting domain-containing protein [Candidatus Aegiribacteria sp.]